MRKCQKSLNAACPSYQKMQKTKRKKDPVSKLSSLPCSHGLVACLRVQGVTSLTNPVHGLEISIFMQCDGSQGFTWNVIIQIKVVKNEYFQPATVLLTDLACYCFNCFYWYLWEGFGVQHWS